MLDQQFNKDIIGYANYWLNQSALRMDQQKIGLLLLNHTNTKVGAIPANFFFSL